MTYTFQNAGQGLVIVSARGRAVARISNVAGRGRWMLRDERRLDDPAYRGHDVTGCIHDHARLAEEIAAELAGAAAR